MPAINPSSTIPASRNNISYKTNSKNKSLRAVIITTNEKKFKEFCSQLGDGYGMEVHQYSPENAEQDLASLCETIMEQSTFSPHFILREQTTLECVGSCEDLTDYSLKDLAKRELDSVKHISRLTVYKPYWSDDLEKKLTGFTILNFEKSTFGYIKSQTSDDICVHGFGWDALFVNSVTGLSNEAFFSKYGKKSARQHVASEFIESNLRYKTLLALKHHNIPLKNPVNFGQDYFHLTTFVKSEQHLSNRYINQWLIETLRNGMINHGLFVKAAWSRPVKNYFSPPFSGLPLTAKKDDAEETIFMTHDILHHLIPDLICDQGADKKSFNVYSAWRMTSEACTLILADMLYADGLIQSNVKRECVDKWIYPLFEAIKITQALGSPDEITHDDKILLLRKLLFANVRYALLGDDSEWINLLAQSNGETQPEHMEKLNGYKNHFAKFFIGDHAWTRANFDNMNKHAERLHTWIDHAGKDTFRKTDIPLLSDACTQLKLQKNNFHEYDGVVNSVFELIFDTRIKPLLEQNRVEFDSDNVVQSRAFRRFLLGQSSLFSRYPVPLNLEYIPKLVFIRLQSDELFSSTEQDKIRKYLKQYILALEGMGLMSRDESLNTIDCATVFPPVYISYPAMEKQYGSIANCVKECVDSYEDPSHPSPSELVEESSETANTGDLDAIWQDKGSDFTQVIDGVTFIDAVALERSIGKDIPAKDRLRQKMINAGVTFWDDKQTIVKKPVVGISAIGGFTVCLDNESPLIKLRMGNQSIGPMTPQSLADGLRETMGSQSTHTFQNPNAKTPHELYDMTVKHGHYSIAHAALISIHILGLSTIAELEFDAQRDLLHLARQTSARDASQDEPCLVAINADAAILAEDIRAYTIETLESYKKTKPLRDWREARNALFPRSGAVSLGINADLRNLQKVLGDINGDGKELEYRNILALINDAVSGLFPELFKSTKELGHIYPDHWSEKAKTNSILTQSMFSFYAKPSSPRLEKKTKDAILVLGAPCAGKTTQLARIVQKHPEVMCISTGNLVRKLDQKVNDALPLTDIEQRAAESLDKMKRGELMDDDAVYALLMAHLSPGGDGFNEWLRADLIILDGIIKAHKNIQSFEKELQKFNDKTNVTLSIRSVINLCVHEKELISRNQARIDAAIEAGQLRRSDDDPEIYRNRLRNYMIENDAILKHYENNLHIINIDGSQNKDQTTLELDEAITKIREQRSVAGMSLMG